MLHSPPGLTTLWHCRRRRFEKTNEKLDSFNDLSSHRLVTTLQDFRKHTHLLVEAKKDLHSIFRRIRSVLVLTRFFRLRCPQPGRA